MSLCLHFHCQSFAGPRTLALKVSRKSLFFREFHSWHCILCLRLIMEQIEVWRWKTNYLPGLRQVCRTGYVDNFGFFNEITIMEQSNSLVVGVGQYCTCHTGGGSYMLTGLMYCHARSALTYRHEALSFKDCLPICRYFRFKAEENGEPRDSNEATCRPHVRRF